MKNLVKTCQPQYGVNDTYLNVIYPMLVRIGAIWTIDEFRPPYEHFISNMVRRKLAISLDALPRPKTGVPTWLLFLPENDYHDIGLLFAHYVIRLSGARTTYLGGKMPERAVIKTLEQIKPDNLILFLAHYYLADDVNRYLERLGKAFDGERIFVSANMRLADSVKEGKKVVVLRSAPDLERCLKR